MVGISWKMEAFRDNIHIVLATFCCDTLNCWKILFVIVKIEMKRPRNVLEIHLKCTDLMEC